MARTYTHSCVRSMPSNKVREIVAFFNRSTSSANRRNERQRFELALVRDVRPRIGRHPRTDFSQFVSSLPAPGTLLGLTHIASSYTLRDILNDGYIAAPTICPVLGEPVVYAFYGRAAFRGGLEFNVTSLASMFPTVIILDPRTVPAPKYIFPFDSGAFVDGKMDQYLHPYMPLFDFLLAPDLASAARLVNAAFGGYDAYFRNNPRTDFRCSCIQL
jgi:hypothetical protein